MMRRLRNAIKYEGQAYYDKPVVAEPTRDEIRNSVRAALSGGKAEEPQPLLLGHERVRLRWLKPDGKGGLVPKAA